MPQLDLSVYFVQALHFTNFFVIILSCFFIFAPIIIGLLKSRKGLEKTTK